METAPGSDHRDTASEPVAAWPEAAVAGDWTFLAVVGAAVGALLLWRRRSRRVDPRP